MKDWNQWKSKQPLFLNKKRLSVTHHQI
ncbi:hypothetical protein DW871_12935 [Sellimonas intestinalis]|nr:hypothetical protein DW871_12935 [Sellimonas intestinalis]